MKADQMPDYRDTLRSIRTFPQLIKFLRDELDWPINSDNFEELTFDYTPEELGIDAASAAKIQEIKRLRPLSVNQPWGIFFIKFEPKQLPVAVLRRVLSRVAVKKRVSANSTERAAWQADDLLFVSNYGEGDERRITFAHFAQDAQKNDLPTLKVLGWDNRDTALHLDQVADVLAEKLAWPDDEEAAENWRETWRSAFTLRHREVITTSKAMAVRLAELARAIRDRINTVLKIETRNGPITKLMKAFQETLVHDLDTDGFADMYAQTIAYGLLSARVTNPKANTADGFAAQLPVTNPFLKELMETFLHVGGRKGKAGRGPGIDFDELGVSEVVELLDDANMEAVVRDFGDKNPQEDPVIHFYELFLKEYDAKKRMQRGVFYTPRPVVSYIVRSVHELLQTEFGLADGLADTATWGEMAKRHEGLKIPEGVKPTNRFVTILDPATGTGTFLVEAIDVIHRTLVEKWKRDGHGEKKTLDFWNEYVPEHLLPRLHGYELLMAPYAIAHLKIGLKLHETGYRFESAERAQVYLTNALEPAHDFSGHFEFVIPALAREAEAVNVVKRQQRFTVIIGNPPYSNFGQLNRIPFILGLLEDYKRGLDERKINLDDDFIKFVRLSQYLLHMTGAGLFGMITNNVFFDGITHRKMREAIMSNFAKIAVLDLHGSAKKLEEAPDGSTDENVFDIQQGVGISIFVKCQVNSPIRVQHADLFGERTAKYERLDGMVESKVAFTNLRPSAPYFFFIPKNFDNQAEYHRGWRTKDVLQVNGDGIETKRDNLTIQFLPTDVEHAVANTRELSEAKLRARYALPADGRDWQVKAAKKDVQKSPGRIVPISYRPFDVRFTYFTGKSRGFIAYPRAQLSRHLRAPHALGLVVNRFVKLDYFSHVFVINCIADKHLLETANSCVNLNPLYLAPEGIEELDFPEAHRTNLSQKFVRAIAAALHLPQSGPEGLPHGLTPEDIFHYSYAVLHSPGYRSRYEEFLKIDFPRLPLTSSLELFRELARLGGELVALHLVEAAAQQAVTARYDKAVKAWRYEVVKGQRLPIALSFDGPEKPVVGRVGWSGETVWIDAVKPKKGVAGAKVTGTVGFRGVPEEVWNFHIGGYQVCEKWLKDRKDRTLTADDITHYHRIVIALHETIRIMREIDEVIDAHGGWPGAFANGSQEPAAKDTVDSNSKSPQWGKRASLQPDLRQPNLFE